MPLLRGAGIDDAAEIGGELVREFGTIHSAYWPSTLGQGFSDDAKLLGAYLMTCSHGTIAGVFRLPDGYVADDVGWERERVSATFTELSSKGFADRCGTMKWVWIRKFLLWNPPANPNQWIAVRKAVDQIPKQCSWRADFIGFLNSIASPDPNRSKTVQEPPRNNNTYTSHPTPPASQQEPSTHTDEQVSRGTCMTLEVGVAGVEFDSRLSFEKLRLSYPKFSGRQDWINAEHHARLLVESGETWDSLQAGVERYAAFVAAGGVSEAKYVMTPGNFFSAADKPWLQPWTPPPKPQNASQRILERLERRKGVVAEQ